MSPACLDSPAPSTLKRQIIAKEGISLTGIAHLESEPTKTTLYGSRAHVRPDCSAVSLANILPTDYF